MSYFIKHLVVVVLIFNSQSIHAIAFDAQLAKSVVKIIAKTEQGRSNMGSGVVISANKVATNCHVVRNAKRISVMKAGKVFKVLAEATLPDFDVCILKTRNMPFPHVALSKTDSLKLGEDIKIYGFPHALGMGVKQGQIVALHHYDNHKVIEINAGFMQGASGGGVFNDAGKLIGLTTFMGREKHNFHFYAIPSDWLILALSAEFTPLHTFDQRSFWETGKFGHLDQKNNP